MISTERMALPSCGVSILGRSACSSSEVGAPNPAAKTLESTREEAAYFAGHRAGWLTVRTAKARRRCTSRAGGARVGALPKAGPGIIRAALPAPRREGVAGAGGIRAGEDLTVKGALGQLLQRELQHSQVILCVVRAGVPGPQNPGQHLTSAADEQRVEAEPALVVPGCQLLLRMDA